MNKLISVIRQNHYYGFTVIIAIGFWYVALFPGRIGYDYSLAIRMIQNGNSTDWWTSTYFWLLKISSFWGNSIFLSSIIGLLILSYSLTWLIFSFPQNLIVKRKALLLLFCTPLFGVFGVTVSHDVFQTSGIILLIGLEVRIIQKLSLDKNVFLVNLVLSYMCLLTVKTGPFIIIFSFISFLVRKKFFVANVAFFLTLLCFFLSSFGVDSKFMNDAKYLLFIADIKCVAQHSEARISTEEWRYLSDIAPIENWKSAKTCSTIDSATQIVSLHGQKLILNQEFFKNYFSIVSKNPAIFLMSHIQRSRGALPPPFFQGPENQVNLDIRKPIGEGTNIALQSGPELLHPSIDEPSVAIKIPLLKPLEMLAQTPTFLINQASWFWGWGGFWLWPILYFWLKFLRNSRILSRIFSLYPIILNHTFLFVLNPGALGRYYMSTILIGVTVCIIIYLQFFKNVQSFTKIK